MARRRPASVRSSDARAQKPSTSSGPQTTPVRPGRMCSRALPPLVTSTGSPDACAFEQHEPLCAGLAWPEEEVGRRHDRREVTMGQPAGKHRVRTGLPQGRHGRPLADHDESMGDALAVQERTERVDELDTALAVETPDAQDRGPPFRDVPFVAKPLGPPRGRERVRIGARRPDDEPIGVPSRVRQPANCIGERDQHLRTPAVEPPEVLRHHRGARPSHAPLHRPRPTEEKETMCECCRRAAAPFGERDTAPSAQRARAWSM